MSALIWGLVGLCSGASVRSVAASFLRFYREERPDRALRFGEWIPFTGWAAGWSAAARSDDKPGSIPPAAVSREPAKSERSTTSPLALSAAKRRFQGLGPILIDIGVGAAAAVTVLRLSNAWFYLPHLALVWVVATLSIIDIGEHVLPDRIIWPFMLASCFVVVFGSGINDYVGGIEAAFVGAATYFLVLFVIHLVNERAMGFGDVKYALILGLYIGWNQGAVLETFRAILWALLIATTVGSVAGLVSGWLAGEKRTEIPFGPMLGLGALIVIWFSPFTAG